MRKNLIYISDAEMQALAVTAAMGNFGLEELVGTAAWALARREEALRDACIRAFLYQNHVPRPAKPARGKTIWERLHGLARRIHSLF
jgi:hypothetical protein